MALEVPGQWYSDRDSQQGPILLRDNQETHMQPGSHRW